MADEQRESGLMVYPESGWRWLFYRAPFWAWRMGAAPLLERRMCVLTTRGRTSGLPRHTMLEYVAHEGRALLGAGWGPRSQWVKNLLADPTCTLASGLGIQHGRAVRVSDGETLRAVYPELKKSPVWMQYCASWGVDGADVDDVAAKAGQLWTFVVEPDPTLPPEARLPTQPLDLWWVPAIAVLGTSVFWLL